MDICVYVLRLRQCSVGHVSELLRVGGHSVQHPAVGAPGGRGIVRASRCRHPTLLPAIGLCLEGYSGE